MHEQYYELPFTFHAASKVVQQYRIAMWCMWYIEPRTSVLGVSLCIVITESAWTTNHLIAHRAQPALCQIQIDQSITHYHGMPNNLSCSCSCSLQEFCQHARIMAMTRIRRRLSYSSTRACLFASCWHISDPTSSRAHEGLVMHADPPSTAHSVNDIHSHVITWL